MADIKRWSYEERRQCWELKQAGYSYRAVSKIMERSESSIRRQWWDYDQRGTWETLPRGAPRRPSPNKRGSYPRVTVPDDVMQERNRRLSAETSIGMRLLGDPLPGQSALDKRMQR